MTSNSSIEDGWLTSIDEAKVLAKEEGKPILISFAGSDWCKPCIKLTKEVFDTPQFESYSQDNLVLLLADFPRLKKNKLPIDQTRHNERLAAKYNRQGIFPLVVVISEKGELLGKIGYEAGGAEGYIKRIQSLIEG